MVFRTSDSADRTEIPERERLEPTSINAQLHALPVVRRTTHGVRGVPLYFPRTGMIMVPYLGSRGGWSCMVLVGNDTYPPASEGGHDLYVSDWEIQRAPAAFVLVPTQGQWRPAGDSAAEPGQ